MVETMVPKEQLLEQRLDGLEKKVDDGFDLVDDRFKLVDERFKQLDKKIDDGFDRVDADIRELRGDMNTLKYGLLSATVLILVALLGPAVL